MNDFALKEGFGNSTAVNVINAKNAKELRKKIELALSQKELAVVSGENPDIARSAVEDKRTDILISCEKNTGKDFMDSRNSGLNSVLCDIAGRNKIAVGFNFNDLLNAENRARILGRMMQNVLICRKSGIKMIVGSFCRTLQEKKNLNELKAFAYVLGMNTKEIAECLNFRKKQGDIEVL